MHEVIVYHELGILPLLHTRSCRMFKYWFKLTVLRNNTEHGDGECIKETINQTNNKKQLKVTDGPTSQQANSTPGGIASAGPGPLTIKHTR